MGEAWVPGTRPPKAHRLVTDGPFRLVRNPIYVGLTGAIVAIFLMTPNPASLAGVLLALLLVESQVRLVEEPWLQKVFGQDYGDYTGSTPRFVPVPRRIKSDVC